MADFKKAMQTLAKVEHNNDNSKLLHKNKGEVGFTFFGIYQTQHPTLKMWNIINRFLQIENDIKKCSLLLANEKEIIKEVEEFYQKEFWNKAKLYRVNSQLKAEEIFIFMVNVGAITGIKELQRFLNVKVDGVVGDITLSAINRYDEDKFSKEFDNLEIAYYEKIIKNKPHLKINLKGWINRALYV